MQGGWRDDEDNGYGEVQEGDERVCKFVYQSCSGRGAQRRGSFGGELTFVPGSIDQVYKEKRFIRIRIFNNTVATTPYKRSLFFSKPFRANLLKAHNNQPNILHPYFETPQ
jgi:hypothetical protein